MLSYVETYERRDCGAACLRLSPPNRVSSARDGAGVVEAKNAGCTLASRLCFYLYCIAFIFATLEKRFRRTTFF